MNISLEQNQQEGGYENHPWQTSGWFCSKNHLNKCPQLKSFIFQISNFKAFIFFFLGGPIEKYILEARKIDSLSATQFCDGAKKFPMDFSTRTKSG